MKAIQVTPKVSNSLALIEASDPQIGEHDVLVRVLQAGIDGTDLEIEDGLYGEAPVGSDYLILGHESLGRIAQVGLKAERLSVGDLVVASVRRPCPHDWCLPCRAGQNDMCVTGDYRERGIRGEHGFMSEYYGEHEHWLVKVPPGLKEVGVLLEPLSIVEKAIRQTLDIQRRLPWTIENAVVLGAGPIGLLGAALLRLRGVETYVLNRSEHGGVKSQMIERLGAHHVNVERIPLATLAANIGRIDLILEATGYAPLVFEAAKHLSANGILCLLGISGGTQTIRVDANRFNLQLVLGNRLIFGSVSAQLADFRSAVEHLQDIQQNWPGWLKGTITRRIPFDDFREAFHRKPGDAKVVLEVGED